VPVEEGRYSITAELAREQIDENTIGVVGILGRWGPSAGGGTPRAGQHMGTLRVLPLGPFKPTLRYLAQMHTVV
jgi:hypothetical protein